LLLLAAGLLLLSFVEWNSAGADGMIPVASAPAVAPTPTLSPADYGRSLFMAKGCSSCHRHDGLEVARVSVRGEGTLVEVIGPPDLTHYQPDPAFVRRWLRDPQAVRPATEMPDLNLSEEEIEALLAFLQTNSAAE
jgi:cytochrome c1